MQVRVRIPCSSCPDRTNDSNKYTMIDKLATPCPDCNGTRWMEYWLPLHELVRDVLRWTANILPEQE